MTILLLGGTRDAIKIGESLTCQYIYSIAGVTDNPSVPNNATVHTGGFSAIGGLQKFIADNNITTVINATHPYASAITETVNNLTDVNVIRYLRPAWEIQNNWIMCEDENQIKDKLSDFTGNVFFALGGKTVQHYSDLNCYLVARVVGDTQITNGECIIGKGAMDMHSEIKLFDKYNFDVVVCKNSGGKINYNKIEIATDRNIPIVMLSRPIDNSKVIIDTIDKVKDYL